MRQWIMCEAGKCLSLSAMKRRKKWIENSVLTNRFPNKSRTDAQRYLRSTQTSANKRRRSLQRWMRKLRNTLTASKIQRQKSFKMEDLWNMLTLLFLFSTPITWITWMEITWAEKAYSTNYYLSWQKISYLVELIMPCVTLCKCVITNWETNVN